MKMTKETSKIVEVTPALAMKIMKNNSKNRPISDSTVKRYAKIMRHEDHTEIKGLINGTHEITRRSYTG